jgi:hypothetical protein
MEKQSIEETKKLIIDNLDKANIPEIDKVELMMNILQFLNDYENNIKVLRKTLKK